MKHRLLPFIAALLMCVPVVKAQNKYIEEGDEAFASGLYKTAIDLYRKGAQRNPSPELTYKMGNASRMANNYIAAIGYYRAIATTSSAVDFPECCYFLALMYKCNAQVDSALLFYNRYLAMPPDNPEQVARAAQEMRSCEWILDSATTAQHSVEYAVIQEGKNINTGNSESGAVLIGDTLLVFSTIQELSAPGSRDAINSDLVLMQIYDAPVLISGKVGPSTPNTWGLNSKEMHTGNVAYDELHQVLFFNRCSVSPDNPTFNNISCDIYYSQLKKGKWQKPKKLGGAVNIDGFSSTQPSVGYLPDSSVILYFSSDRPGGVGGFDIWYTIISKDDYNPTVCINLGIPVNTPGNEITPFYDNAYQRLYFSSDWHYGFGGYDVLFSKGNRDTWEQPLNLGSSLNSPANDIYFSVNTSRPNSGYLSSNRSGSKTYNNSNNTCCNDIYRWNSRPFTPKREEKVVEPIVVERKGAVHNLLPISLYFHNDEPDPKSELFTTTATYFQTYNRYMFMRNRYKDAHSGIADTAQRDSVYAVIDNFFDHDVHDNCKRVEEFMTLLTDDLRNGRRVSITVEGYASPVHTSKYNFKISKRRVGSIVNQLMEYNNGALKQFIGSKNVGSLQVREVAYGSTHAANNVSSDRGNAARSVYSVEAARERRIEILDYQYLEDASTLITCLRLPSRALNVGTFHSGEVTDFQVRLPHTAVHETTLDFISVGNPDVKVLGYSKLSPGGDLVIYLRMDNRGADPVVSAFIPLTIRVKEEQVTQTMFLEYAVEK